jgi:hypothetical protein
LIRRRGHPARGAPACTLQEGRLATVGVRRGGCPRRHVARGVLGLVLQRDFVCCRIEDSQFRIQEEWPGSGSGFIKRLAKGPGRHSGAFCVGATPIHRRRLRIRHAAAPGIAFHTVKCRAAGDVPAQGGIPALTRPPGGGTLVLTSENVCAASSLPEMRKGRICGIFSIPRCGWICRNFAFLRCGRVCGNDFSFSAKCRSGPIRTPRMDSRVVLQHNH